MRQFIVKNKYKKDSKYITSCIEIMYKQQPVYRRFYINYDFEIGIFKKSCYTLMILIKCNE